jgi:peptidoglycan/xylan/chitin deacetylase (PgdA/CDA1 family)
MMRHRRSLFALVALAVFGVSLGAGATVGYGRASPLSVAIVGTSAPGNVGSAGTDASVDPSTSPSVPSTPSAGASASPSASSVGSSPSGSPPPIAAWPLVAADAPGPSFDFAVQVPVLMYHRVARPDQVGLSLPGLVVAPDLFAAQLETLVAAGWQSITAAQLAADLAAGIRPPLRTFVITFDDGRSDGYTQAFPILRRLGLVATYYVITGRIGLTNNLSASQLRRLAAAGMEIGSHTIDHVRLSSADPSAARLELAGSADRIAAVTGQRPTTFAYPFGGLDPFAQGLVQATGYAMAFTEVSGCRMSWPTRLAAPRVRVSAWTQPADLLHRLEACTGGD